MEAAFVDVQVFEHLKSLDGDSVHSYQEVFEKDKKTIHKRIVIQADPGCGKTTFVYKLARDWANEDAIENKYLRAKFDFIFLIALQTLTVNINDKTKDFLPHESEQWFESYAKKKDESKSLLILDGFDELVENSDGHSSVKDVLNGKSVQFQFFNLIVTTRRSHVDKIPREFHSRSLLIKGFDEQSMKQFLDKQHVSLPSVGQHSKLSHLLQTPLYCTVYCLLYFGGGDPIELEDSYDLIKALVENSVENTVMNKRVLNKEEELDEIGKFALQMLDSESLEFAKKFCRSSKVIKPSFDLSRVTLDLLIKRRIPLVGVNRFKEDFSLPHKLIAEYLAARYFASSLTEEQLKQADASKLNLFALQGILDRPFGRFFLFELLFLYLEKKYNESVFDKFLNIHEIRLFWNCKSNKDIPTLDNVSDLYFHGLNYELVNHSRFIPILSKCGNLSSLTLWDCYLSENQVEQIVNFINNSCFQKLIRLNLADNQNVGSSTDLFNVLHKCQQLQLLDLSGCLMTQESLNIFLSTFNSNTFQQLDQILLRENRDIKVDDNFFIALEKCPKISEVHLSKSVEGGVLSEVGRKATETLDQRSFEVIVYDDDNDDDDDDDDI